MFFNAIYYLTTLRMQLQPVFRCSSLNALDPGGRETPAILPQNPSTVNGQVPGWSCILNVDKYRAVLARGLIPCIQPLKQHQAMLGKYGPKP